MPQLSYVRVCVNLSACVWACGVSVDAVPVWVGRGYLVSSGSQEHITYIRCIPAVSHGGAGTRINGTEQHFEETDAFKSSAETSEPSQSTC